MSKNGDEAIDNDDDIESDEGSEIEEEIDEEIDEEVEPDEESEARGYLNLGGAFNIGYDLRYVERAAAHQYPVRTSDEEQGQYIVGALHDIVHTLNNSNIDSFVINEIEGKKNYLENKYDVPDDSENNINISQSDATELEHSIRTWQRLLRAELASSNRYAPVETNVVKTESLLLSPDLMFEDRNLWEELPEQVQEDLAQAIKSLAFGSPTGSVFLSLRAVEDRLREWYEHETDNDIEDRTFGQVIGELDDQYNKSEKPAILAHLNYLKHRRNEVAHPERSPDIREAESTLVNVRETIYEIHNQLNN
ncbi:hypothetical protein [Halorubrum ezzemoulense]|uniref:hypothetical protein n=1 Tax=Halorubrum ezzemoulense TaxID=337243 RepID=UPI00232E3D01|nr:hypothetical protein [Halorubrum ezzemoulense]MDB2237571.1 hypothetical protein [Halorubrum ezzemoulense]MDB2248935.1 hypothetical protein [Halorubrum ezzemoulense]